MMDVRVAVLVSAMACFVSGNPASAADVGIADARAAPGSTVSLRGTVTVAAGAFASSTFDQGFALQDATGGIYVTIARNPGLSKGSHARVTGTVSDDGNGLVVLQVAGPADVRRIAATTDPLPLAVTSGDVGEATEGLLIEVSGTVTRGPTDDMPYGYSLYIDDGTGETQVFMPASTGVNPFRIPFAKPGSRIRVTGFGGQYQSQYEVLPRVRADIVKLP